MQRPSPMALLLLMALTLPMVMPMAAGQSSEGAVLAEDSSGDVGIIGPDGQPAGSVPADAFTGLDLKGVGIQSEDEETVSFYVEVASISEQSETPAPFLDPDYAIYFRFGEMDYRVLMQTALSNPVNDATNRQPVSTSLQESTGTGWRTAARGQGEVLDAENRVVAAIPREAIVDDNQAPLARGSQLTDFVAEASVELWTPFLNSDSGGGILPVQYHGVGLIDRAPDRDVGAAYTMTTGSIIQAGDLFSRVAEPVRWTNGEATTLVYEVEVQNRGSKLQRVDVSVTGTPGTWEVAHSDVLEVEAGSSQNVTILVSIPFTHAHGTFEEFLVHFQSPDGHASTSLAVYWPLIPQPAGHHDTLWFHGAVQERGQPWDDLFPQEVGWINAAPPETDQEDAGTSIPANWFVPSGAGSFAGGSPTEGRAQWFYSLSPQLRMGLDFDLSQLGSLDIVTELPVPMLDPTVDVNLGYLVIKQQGRFLGGGESEWTTIGAGSATTAGQQQGKTPWSIPLAIESSADEIPFRTDGNLGLIITMRGTMVGATWPFHEATAPVLVTSQSTMTLPLFEYHDPVDEVFVTSSAIRLSIPAGGQERMVNPGEAVVYQFAINYDGARPDTFDLALTGTNAEWGRILGDTTISLEAGSSRTLALEVLAPANARHGETSDITITATSTRNAAVQGGVRTLTTVTTAEDLVDESGTGAALDGELTEGKDSPGVGLIVVLSALAAVAAVAQRNRMSRRP